MPPARAKSAVGGRASFVAGGGSSGEQAGSRNYLLNPRVNVHSDGRCYTSRKGANCLCARLEKLNGVLVNQLHRQRFGSRKDRELV